MASKVENYLEKSESKLLLAKNSYSLSTNSYLRELSGLPREMTFFNETAQQSYFSIFYAAKAYLISNNFETFPPGEHSSTYNGLERELNCNGVDSITAKRLMWIYYKERLNRGKSTYDPGFQLDGPAAKISISHAEEFLSAISSLIENDRLLLAGIKKTERQNAVSAK
jgi:uncharacterized protein (UPF0332 family)